MKKVKITKSKEFPEFTGDIEVVFDETLFDLVPEHFPPGLAERLYKGNRVRWVSESFGKKRLASSRSKAGSSTCTGLTCPPVYSSSR